MNLVCPPPPLLPARKKICITIISNFSWVVQSSQEKSKTMVMQNCGGANKVHYGLCGNGEFLFFSLLLLFPFFPSFPPPPHFYRFLSSSTSIKIVFPPPPPPLPRSPHSYCFPSSSTLDRVTLSGLKFRHLEFK